MTTSPQVAALTNSDGLWPTCERQSPAAILSRISASRVARSGMRSSASARHISATPSWVESEYSRMRPSTRPGAGLGAQLLDQIAGHRAGRLGLARWRQRRLGEQQRQAFGLGPASRSGDPRHAKRLCGADIARQRAGMERALGRHALASHRSARRARPRSIAAISPCLASQCGDRPMPSAAAFRRALQFVVDLDADRGGTPLLPSDASQGCTIVMS